MSLIEIKGKFHTALNGKGLILQGSPERPAYSQSQSPVFGNRFASGDRSYNDMSKWWYFNQSDWSGGMKDEIAWKDDAKYYLSENIDTWSEPGSIKLARKQSTVINDFAEDILCGCAGIVGGTSMIYLGGEDNGTSNKPIIYSYNGSTFTDISSTVMHADSNYVSHLLIRSNYLWAFMTGTSTGSNTYRVMYYDGANWVDCTDHIVTKATSIANCVQARCAVELDSILYVFVQNSTDTSWSIVKCSVLAPTLDGDWSLVGAQRTNNTQKPVACVGYGGNLYYLLQNATSYELRVYNVADNVDAFLYNFIGVGATEGVSDKYLNVYRGVLMITIPTNGIWIFDGTSLERIYIKDARKAGLAGSALGYKPYSNLYYGAVVSNDKIFWDNLVFDGNTFNYWITPLSADAVGDAVKVLFVDTTDRIWLTDLYNDSLVSTYSHTNAVYKGTAGKNYILLNRLDEVSGIDKLAYSCTLLFDPLISGQKISISYRTSALSSSSFTALGNVDYSIDGGTVRDKKILFPASTVFKNIWIRIDLEAGGTDTPVVTDFVMEYLPMPTPTKVWSLSINCADEVKRLDGNLVETTGREMRSMLEFAWWTKSVLDYQDVDFATSTVNGSLSSSATTVTVVSTLDFPEQGRLKIGDEEIFYTGKTPTTFTGCTRGVRDTRAVAHSNADVCNNGFKVLLTNLSFGIPIMDEGRELEYVANLQLMEV